MRDVLDRLNGWLAAGHRVALATIVQVERSAPRPPGSAMAVNDAGEVAGSVSGGCVEGALYGELQGVLASGSPRVVTYGISDDEAFEVGLSCGGTLHLFVEPLDRSAALLRPLADALRTESPVALASVLSGPAAGAKLLVGDGVPQGGTDRPDLDAAIAREARAMLAQGLTGLRSLSLSPDAAPQDLSVFVASFAPPPRLFVFGSVDHAAALVRAGKLLGFRVTLCDARPVFATRERFPEADEIVVGWPHEYLAGAGVGPRDAVCALTHDPKFDVPALLVALRTPAFYIGAMGSRRTCERRNQALLESGATPEEVQRISAPVGLDLGGGTPEEMALAVAAEMIAVRNGRAGGRLRDTRARIHAPEAGAAPARG